MLQKTQDNTIKSGMSDSNIINIVVSCAALVLIWAVAFVVIIKLKKKLDPRLKRDEPFAGLRMEDLEKIHRAGMISDEEFASMRRSLLGLPPLDGDEKNKKIHHPAAGFDIMKNLGKTDKN
ncbi:MAG TPA: hypothetical protein PKK48_07585 [Phycisphaerae bacterium]|nr:hypothetical protein [Phycisphaerae bacterium]HPS52488.1 hypothetical protein [Phycisphaerae bacterium]